jgi:hypothetical protein
VPFPERLTDEEWSLKWAQVKFLAKEGILGKALQKALE